MKSLDAGYLLNYVLNVVFLLGPDSRCCAGAAGEWAAHSMAWHDGGTRHHACRINALKFGDKVFEAI